MSLLVRLALNTWQNNRHYIDLIGERFLPIV